MRLTSHNTASIASPLKIHLGLDRQDLKLNHDTIKVYFTSSLIELLTHKPAASFRKFTKFGQNRVSNRMKNFTM